MTDLLSMDEILAPTKPVSGLPWPQSPPAPGQVYGFTCPATGANMVAMLKDTFLNYGTSMEAMRRAAEALDKRCKTLVAEHAEALDRLNALREATRKDRRDRLEDRIQLPGEKQNTQRRR